MRCCWDLCKCSREIRGDRRLLRGNSAGRIIPTMLHAQGRGGEQFGYSHLTPYRLAGWQYFYTANVSVKKALVRNWILEGFDTGFFTAAYEDLEFAYRQSQPPKGLRIFYDPAAIAAHHHHYTLPQFMDRQSSLAAARALLLDRFCQRLRPSLHEELADWSFLAKGLIPPRLG